MTSKRSSDEKLIRAIGTGFAEDILSDDYPVADVEQELREAGADPKAIGNWGASLVRDLAKNHRLAWQSEASRIRDQMQSRLAARQTVPVLARAELLARIDLSSDCERMMNDIRAYAKACSLCWILTCCAFCLSQARRVIVDLDRWLDDVDR